MAKRKRRARLNLSKAGRKIKLDAS